ncbi:unnamed protein product [Onchocerca flexuosa]|uniref:CPXV005 protein n=1 Tax=Onchocerca flexuosa TaxID=387005 RepID=A0A183HIZ0_9BILA|nr:unnamed protein product [Onchocerca flexuosa]
MRYRFSREMSDSECNSNTDDSIDDDSLNDLEMDMENNDGQYLSDAGKNFVLTYN